MGTPMISQIFLRGVYHVNCSRAPIEVREMLPCSPWMREPRWDCFAVVNFVQKLPARPEFGQPGLVIFPAVGRRRQRAGFGESKRGKREPTLLY